MSPEFLPAISTPVAEQVRVPPPPPPPVLTADFTFSPIAPLVNQTVTFTGSASGGSAPYSFFWTFGDGSSATGSPVVHAYSNEATYTVELVVVDSVGQAVRITKSVVVRTTPPPVTVVTELAFRPSNPDPSQVGQSVTLGMWLERIDAGIGLRFAGETLIVELSADGFSWSEIARGVTNSSGDLFVLFTFPIEGTFTLRSRYLGRTDPLTNQTFLPSTSNLEPHTVGAGTVQVPTSMTLGSTPNPSVAGQSVAISGRLIRTDNGAGVGGQTVTIESFDGASWTPFLNAFTAPDGSFGATHAFQAAGTYVLRASYTGSTGFGASTSPSLNQLVNPSVTDVAATLTLVTSPNPSQTGQIVAMSGRLTRNDTGAGVSGQPISLQSSTDGVNFTTFATAVTDVNGNYSTSFTFSVAGSYNLRASFAGATI